MEFLARLDGSVGTLATISSSKSGVYPAQYQIPLGSLCGLQSDQGVVRIEMFVTANLLYEIMTRRPPFEKPSDQEV